MSCRGREKIIYWTLYYKKCRFISIPMQPSWKVFGQSFPSLNTIRPTNRNAKIRLQKKDTNFFYFEIGHSIVPMAWILDFYYSTNFYLPFPQQTEGFRYAHKKHCTLLKAKGMVGRSTHSTSCQDLFRSLNGPLTLLHGYGSQQKIQRLR